MGFDMKRGFVLVVALLLTSCGGSEGLTIIRLSDEKIVGRDSLKGRFRDMVLGCDEAKGRLAIIEWGDYKSTIKLFDLTAGTFTKHAVPVGRLNGLAGPEYYDFASDEYIFHDRQGIRFFGKGSQLRDVANPLPEGFWGSKIVPWKGQSLKRDMLVAHAVSILPRPLLQERLLELPELAIGPPVGPAHRLAHAAAVKGSAIKRKKKGVSHVLDCRTLSRSFYLCFRSRFYLIGDLNQPTQS
jgi:hypothetical protein